MTATTSTGPILIMSSERSGSNLLRTLLSNHSRLAAPMAAQFLNLFPQYLPRFGSLEQRENMEQLVRAMLLVANHKTFGWGLELDVPTWVAQNGPKDLIDAFDGLYRARAAMEGAQRYVCKENRLFDHAETLLARIEGLRILFLVRDPRDYALSWMRAPILNNTPHEAACAWRDEQRACLAVEQHHPDRVHRVTYEDLVQDPEGVMTRVLDFVGETPEPACFQVQGEKNKGQEWSSFWKNLTKPVQSSNFHKFRGEFKPRTLEMMETVCRAEMASLGYAPDTAQRWRPGPWFELRERRLARRNDERLRREHADTVAVLQDRDAQLARFVEGLAPVRDGANAAHA
ncbi:MAG: sulfotransferase [Planctomycetota bacterium]